MKRGISITEIVHLPNFIYSKNGINFTLNCHQIFLRLQVNFTEISETAEKRMFCKNKIPKYK